MKVVQHNPNCAIFRRGDLHAWCDCGAEAPVLEEIRRKVWHKIGADHERALIVAWLRKENGRCDCFAYDDNECACGGRDEYKSWPLEQTADRIEAGEHRDD